MIGTRLRAGFAALTMAGGLGVAAGPAQAQTTPPPEVLYVAPRVITTPFNPDEALVIGVYRCFGGQADHLWVSVKQGGPDPTAEGSGATSTAWYDTNIAGEPVTICDGRYHSAVVPVGRYPNKAELSRGEAWIQFCLVAPDPTGQSDFGIVASQSEWATVVGI